MIVFRVHAFIITTSIVIFLLLFLVWFQYVYKPNKKMNDTYKRIITGYTLHDLYYMRYSPSPELEAVFSIVQDIIDSKEMIDASKKQAQYIALQNQINPHFLYNTLESIRSEAIIEGLDSVAEITEMLATFYRYTISNIEQSVTLESELNHIKSYVAIQKFRFGDKLDLVININSERDVLGAYIPKLILQPIVENSIYHGIERKVGQGTVTIDIFTTERDINISISDNGVGMNENQLTTLVHRLNWRSYTYLKEESRDSKGIALINVNTRLVLLYGEDYQLNVLSTENVGTDVEINIPLSWEQDHETRSY